MLRQINELKIVRMYSDSDSSLVYTVYGNPSAEKFNYLRKTSWIPSVAMKLTNLIHKLYEVIFAYGTKVGLKSTTCGT
jgi:hypothetical protein